jgi:hypothetical protein
MFTNGHAMGSTATTPTTTTEKNGVEVTTAEYLLPDRGIIMGTGDPDQFCMNDSDVQSTNWGKGGDADLTSIAKKTAENALTYDAVSSLFLRS